MKTETISERGKIFLKRFGRNYRKFLKKGKKGRVSDSEQRGSASD